MGSSRILDGNFANFVSGDLRIGIDVGIADDAVVGGSIGVDALDAGGASPGGITG